MNISIIINMEILFDFKSDLIERMSKDFDEQKVENSVSAKITESDMILTVVFETSLSKIKDKLKPSDYNEKLRYSKKDQALNIIDSLVVSDSRVRPKSDKVGGKHYIKRSTSFDYIIVPSKTNSDIQE